MEPTPKELEEAHELLDPFHRTRLQRAYEYGCVLQHDVPVEQSAASDAAWKRLVSASKAYLVKYGAVFVQFVAFIHCGGYWQYMVETPMEVLRSVAKRSHHVKNVGCRDEVPKLAAKLLKYLENEPASPGHRLLFALFIQQFVAWAPTHDPATAEAAVKMRHFLSTEAHKEKECTKRADGTWEPPKKRRLPRASHLAKQAKATWEGWLTSSKTDGFADSLTKDINGSIRKKSRRVAEEVKGLDPQLASKNVEEILNSVGANVRSEIEVLGNIKAVRDALTPLGDPFLFCPRHLCLRSCRVVGQRVLGSSSPV